MIARRSVWSKPEIQELAQHFVVVADEVHRLQSRQDPECQWFQQIAEQGHYAGRTQPSNTRQGIYMATPSGVFLASLNSTRAEQVLAQMQVAMRRWRELATAERLVDPATLGVEKEIQRHERQYPADGLVLQVFSRDLPRERQADGDWRTAAWNQDFAWFRPGDMQQMLPENWAVGSKRDLPEDVLRRLARVHLVDNVRGQTPAFHADQVERANWSVEIVEESDGVYRLRYTGETRTLAKGLWAVNGFKDLNRSQRQERGIETQLLGYARYDRNRGRFVEFDLVAAGMRWGGTQYNGRADDLDPAPIGYSFRLAGDLPADRVPPELFYAYGW